MKLMYSASSPYVRKVRIAAMELGLFDRFTLVPITVSPMAPNPDYAALNPLRKIPALILDDGTVIVDSVTIVDYLDDLAGGGRLMPREGAARWRARSDHAILQGMLDALLLCRYEQMVRPQALRWQAWIDDQWDRAWQGFRHFEQRGDVLDRPLDVVQIALVCTLGYADFRFADRPWRDAFPKLAAFHACLMERPSVRDTVPPSA